jgi:hypothetical protein
VDVDEARFRSVATLRGYLKKKKKKTEKKKKFNNYIHPRRIYNCFQTDCGLWQRTEDA